MISIPEYFTKYINPKVDLTSTPKVCCPFHDEDTPSFSYSIEKNTWRCFGACKKGGDVIAMHQANYRFKTREEARASLFKILGIEDAPSFKAPEKAIANEKSVEYAVTYATALRMARTVEDWIELDYIMSQSPPDVFALAMFVDVRKKV